MKLALMLLWSWPAWSQLTIWNSGTVPANTSFPDATSVELGVKFRSDVAGQVAGIRFYKGAGNGGTHVGNLWNVAGVRLATVTFAAESATGWQQALFAAPVAIGSGTVYIASYFAPQGMYAANGAFFASAGVDNPPLHALQTGNGVFRYTSASAFPTSTFNSTNYWVDVLFVPTGAGGGGPLPMPPTGLSVAVH
jgi:hypothetical protein